MATNPRDHTFDHVIARARRDDRDALEVVARRALSLALRVSAATLGSRAEAGDVAQEVAIEVLRGLRKLRNASSFDGWVHAITVRAALRHLKAQRSRREMALNAMEEHEYPTGSDEGAFDRSDATPALRNALAALPPKQRLALGLKYVVDLSDQEIADALGCRLGTASSLLSRGRDALETSPWLASFRASHLRGDA